MAEEGSWAGAARHGLRSAEGLLDLFEVGEPRRSELLGRRRSESVRIAHREHGAAMLRDQKPLSDAALSRCLEDMRVGEWYRLLNRHVFFWPTEARLDSFLRARSYRGRAHDVIVVDTRALLESHGARVRVSPINTGSTIRAARPRGSATLCTLDAYPARRRTIAELAVQDSVPDIAELAVRVERRRAGCPVTVLGR